MHPHAMQFDPSGGYRTLDSWTLASIARLATRRFCQKFLTRDIDPTGRQYDQMTQSARSGKANIVEGSARSGTSKETEMKLTDVARASLAELQSDYETWLLRQNLVPWHRDSPEAQAVYAIRLDKPNYGADICVFAQKLKIRKGILHSLREYICKADYPWRFSRHGRGGLGFRCLVSI